MSTEHLGPDPLDPHGDGTIRPGDPMWHILMSGEAIHAKRTAHDPHEWDVTRLPATGAGDESADRVDRNPPLVPGRRDYYYDDEGADVFRGLIAGFVFSAAILITVWAVIAIWMAVTR